MAAKPVELFYIRGDTGIRRRECIDCQCLRQRERDTGVTEVLYQALLIAQSGACAICKTVPAHARNKRLAADHNHKTGRVRGLLCSNCNTALGLLKDNPERCEIAATYLRTKI